MSGEKDGGRLALQASPLQGGLVAEKAQHPFACAQDKAAHIQREVELPLRKRR
jgi:hypothetical protein